MQSNKMFDFSNQLIDSSTNVPLSNDVSYALNGQDSQYFSEKGIQFGLISYENQILHADLLWDINTLQDYAEYSSTTYAAQLTLVNPDGTIENNYTINSIAKDIRDKNIPESLVLDVSEYLDEITGTSSLNCGSSLYLGISQISDIGSSAGGSVAMATSLNLTNLINQDIAENLLPLESESGDLLYIQQSLNNCQEKKIGIDADLQNCKFEFVNLDGVIFGYSNQDQPPKYRDKVNLSGSSFQGSSLRNTKWGWDGLDIIKDITINEHSYSQEWTSVERKNDPSAATSLKHADLQGATFTVHDNARTPSGLNSATIEPTTPPLIDFANVRGIKTFSWNSKQEKQMPSFVTVTNASNRDIELSNIVTNMFRPWSARLGKGEIFQAWGTTGAMLGNDIILESPGVQIIANNPTVAEANVKVNGNEVDNTDTIRYSQGGVYVNWLGDQDGAKSWDIKFVN